MVMDHVDTTDFPFLKFLIYPFLLIFLCDRITP